MQTEIEAKFTDVDPASLKTKLRQVGALCIYPEVLMRRRVYDFPTPSAQEWMRVRDEGDKITVSYKSVNERTLSGTKEINIVVDDFDKACELLRLAGMIEKSYQETKREKWKLGGVEITIDTWPWIPTFVEFEGTSEKDVKETACALGFDWQKAMYGSVEPVYQMHYDFTESEINHWPLITFTAPPDWLMARKKGK